MESRLHELRGALDALPRCIPYKARPSIALPREGHQKSAYLEGECIWLKSACKEEVRERLREHYLAAKRGMDAYTGARSPTTFPLFMPMKVATWQPAWNRKSTDAPCATGTATSPFTSSCFTRLGVPQSG